MRRLLGAAQHLPWRPLARVSVVLGCVVLPALAWAPAAGAHPLGVPQTVRIEGEGRAVQVRWAAAPDDLAALGLHLGVTGAPRTFVFQDGALVPGDSDPSDATLLARSGELSAYLLRNVGVSQDGRACPGAVVATTRLAEVGARLRFRCRDDVARVRVTVSTLTDLHPAYRTAASTSAGQRAMYTRAQVSHDWQLAGSGETGRDLASPWLVAGAGATTLAVAVALPLFLGSHGGRLRSAA